MKIKSNTTNKDLPWRFGPYRKPSTEENGFSFSIFFCRRPLIETETSR